MVVVSVASERRGDSDSGSSTPRTVARAKFQSPRSGGVIRTQCQAAVAAGVPDVSVASERRGDSDRYDKKRTAYA